jgi:hypothetical protein
VIRVKDDRPQELTFSQLTGENEPLAWRVHPKADVAVLRLKLANNITSLLAGHALLRENMLQELRAPSRDIPLSIIGFPRGIGVQDRFSPVLKESKAASGLLNLPAVSEASMFLSQDPITQGFSGSPVFQLPSAYSSGSGIVFSKNFACVGLAKGTISDETGGKLGVVIPAKYILDAIDEGIPATDSHEEKK